MDLKVTEKRKEIWAIWEEGNGDFRKSIVVLV